MVIPKKPPLDRVFHALADPTRRRILEQLACQAQPVMELVRQFAISQPAVTKHLHVLEEAGLITRRKDGRLRCCYFQPQALQASLDWIQSCRRFWNERLDNLEDFLAESMNEGPKNAPQ
jgi:DNA-binding transcriptional ArsR family regulator